MRESLMRTIRSVPTNALSQNWRNFYRYARTQSDILARVAELRKNEQYLTDREFEENQSQIKTYQDSYDRYTAQIKRNDEKIQEKQATIEKNNAKIKELDAIQSQTEEK